MVSLPRLLIIGEYSYCHSNVHWLTQLQAIVAILHQYPMVTLQLRNKYHPDVWRIIAPYLEKWVQTHPTQCIINGSIFPELSCGRHLPESQIGMSHPEQGYLMGASIHSLNALHQASEMGVHYVQYGAIFPTSKPVTPAGIDSLQTICGHTRIPVLAVGGINTVQRVKECLSAGAYGVSVGSWILQSKDPCLVIKQIVEEIALFMSNPQQSC